MKIDLLVKFSVTKELDEKDKLIGVFTKYEDINEIQKLLEKNN